jgi:hypothetical protein
MWLTVPVLNFPKNDMISSSYAGQATNAPRARCDRLCSLSSTLALWCGVVKALFDVQGRGG